MTLRARTANEKVVLENKKNTRTNIIKTTAKSAVLLNIQNRKAAPTAVTVKSALLPTVQQGRFSFLTSNLIGDRHFLETL